MAKKKTVSREIKSGRTMLKNMATGGAKQKMGDISTRGLEAMVRGAQGYSPGPMRRVADQAAAELARRNGGKRPARKKTSTKRR